MKNIHRLYISILLIFSLFIISSSLYAPTTTTSVEVNTQPITNKVAYLTFDDGPSENTLQILDILNKYEISATFFVVGPEYRMKNEHIKSILENGHALAIHSYSHNYSEIYKNKDAFLQDFYMCQSWIYKLTQTTPNIYRFPGGSSTTIASKSTIKSIIKELEALNFYHVDWNVDSYDSHYNKDTSAIINNTINTIKFNESNGVYSQTILFHDSSKKLATIHALPSIIEYLLSGGYTFKNISVNTDLPQHVKA